MRSLLFASIAVVSMAFTGAANAQLNISVNTKEPMTGLDSDKWAYLERNSIDATTLIGTPRVYIVNATPDDLTVNCDKWVLVGNKPYIKDNPHTLHPWKVTEISAEGFDGYCKTGVVGLSSGGEAYKGKLNAADGTFTNSTFITFSLSSKQ